MQWRAMVGGMMAFVGLLAVSRPPLNDPSGLRYLQIYALETQLSPALLSTFSPACNSVQWSVSLIAFIARLLGLDTLNYKLSNGFAIHLPTLDYHTGKGVRLEVVAPAHQGKGIGLRWSKTFRVDDGIPDDHTDRHARGPAVLQEDGMAQDGHGHDFSPLG